VRDIQETDEMQAMTLGPAAPVVTSIEILAKRDGEEM
jgi:hypothetical protein